jgi:hypothetical protein
VTAQLAHLASHSFELEAQDGTRRGVVTKVVLEDGNVWPGHRPHIATFHSSTQSEVVVL